MVIVNKTKFAIVAAGTLLFLALLGYGVSSLYGYLTSSSETTKSASSTSPGATTSAPPAESKPSLWERITGKKSGGDGKTVVFAVNQYAGYAPLPQVVEMLKAQGITMVIKIMNDFEPSRDAFRHGEVDVLWGTAGGFANESAGLLPDGAQIWLKHDDSRGADCVVVKSHITKFADLRGKTVAVAQNFPSYELFTNLLKSSELTARDFQPRYVPSGLEAAAAFKDATVDAAVVWAPDDQDLLKSVQGSHVIASTAEATHLISDVWIAKKEWLENNSDLAQKVAEAILTANAKMNTDLKFRGEAIVQAAALFKVDKAFFVDTVGLVRYATYGDNLNFFSLAGASTSTKGEELYNNMAAIYKESGILKVTQPSWKLVSNDSIVKAIKLDGPIHEPEDKLTFTKASKVAANAPAVTTKSAIINFASASSDLDGNAKAEIDRVFGPIALTYQGGRMRISGHTDSTGSASANDTLSFKRAEAVRDYLVRKYGFDVDRFDVKGYGSSKPAASNTTVEGRDKNRRTDIELLEVPVR